MKSQLWQNLSKANIVSGDLPEHDELESPWYVKILLAFSGWLAAIFLLGFFFSLFSHLYKNVPLSLGIGSALILGAFVLLRTKGNEFVEHLALAISLAGQILLLVGINQYLNQQIQGNDDLIIWLSIAIVHLCLMFLMPNTVHRVFSSFMTGIGFAATLFYFQENLTAPTIYSAFLMLITAFVWLNEFSFPKHIHKLQAIGYGLVLALITLNVTKIFTPYGILGHRYDYQPSTWFQPWMGEALFSAVTLFVVWTLLKKSQPRVSKQTMIVALLGTLVLSFLSSQAHGLIVGIMILLLGFSASNRLLLGLGVLSLLFFISYYYYSLANTLLDKSITLGILGIALLIARWLMLRFLPNIQIGEPS